MKKRVLEFIQMLAVSIFVGVALYGVLIYWGGEVSEKLPPLISVLLGFSAVVCVVVIVYLGGVLDKMAAAAIDETLENNSSRK